METVQLMLTPKEAAKALGTSANVLAKWRSTNDVRIPYVKLGRKVLYRAIDINNVIDKNVIKMETVA